VECRPPDRPPAVLQTTIDADRRQRAKQYWSIRRASNEQWSNVCTAIVIAYASQLQSLTELVGEFGCETAVCIKDDWMLMLYPVFTRELREENQFETP